MSWSIGYDEQWERDIGYGVPAWCDHPRCHKRIHRGLAYVCGGEPYGGEHGCGLYFCTKHLAYYNAKRTQACSRCGNYKAPYTPRVDHPEWIAHKMTDASWAEWRAAHPGLVVS